MNTKRLATILIIATLAMAIVPSVALAKGPGGGGGGGGGHTTVANNLSVPTIMIGGGFAGVTCGTVGSPSLLIPPSGIPLAGYTIDPNAYYYAQGIHKWQAQCQNDTTAIATAEWGDNLTGDAKLKVGSPIRVEIGLFDATGVTMDGYTVVKLEPEKLDRESAYGTLATADDTGGYFATPTTFTRVRVFDAQVTFSIKNVATGTYVVQPDSNPTAEINASGSVIYGYNLRVTQVGQYEITFVIPNVDITGVDGGTYINDPLGPDTVTLIINVISGGGGRRP